MLGKGLWSLVEYIKLAGESITRSPGNLDLEAPVQSDGGFQDLGVSCQQAVPFRRGGIQEGITERKFFGNCFTGLFKKNIRDIGNVRNVLMCIALETCLSGVFNIDWMFGGVWFFGFFVYFFFSLNKRDLLHMWS